MKAPQKKGMTVNGKRMDLEHFLLEVIDRPMPKEPTHYVLVDVLNTDLSIKRVTIYFNPTDTWKGNCNFNELGPESVGTVIGDGLTFLNRDPNTLAYKYWIIEIMSNSVVHNGWTYSCTKCNV
jgi:hypothetical protein